MRIRNVVIIGTGLLLLVAGCGGGDQKQARHAAEQAELGRKARATRRPARPPPPRKIDCARVKCVALTFDDGPGPHTARLLDTLKADGARATFFMLGENVHAHRDVVRRMVMEGHEVANHTWSHPDLTTLSPAGVRSQIQRTQKAIKDTSGVAPTLVRPPYRATNDEVGRAVGMPLILWSVDTMDWRYRSVGRDIRVGIQKPERGGIVLYHDIHKPSVDAIPKVVDGLKKRGFTLVTVSELFQGERLKAGQTYNERARKTDPVTASPPPPGSPAGTPAGSPSAGSPSVEPSRPEESPAGP